MKKTQTVLYIYDLLAAKGYIAKQEIMSKANINELTFKRYLKDIREYLDAMHTGKELIYSKRNGRYYLTTKIK